MMETFGKIIDKAEFFFTEIVTEIMFSEGQDHGGPTESQIDEAMYRSLVTVSADPKNINEIKKVWKVRRRLERNKGE